MPAAFDAGAAAYDGLVGANPGYHRAPADVGSSACGLPTAARDCACSTRAAAPARPPPRCCPRRRDAEIVAVDASAGMLAEAAAKRWPATVRFVHSRIEDLAAAGVDGPFDGIFAAYLLRNLADPDAQLQTFRTLLRPGGDAGGARILGARLPVATADVERGVRDDHHPGGPAAHR